MSYFLGVDTISSRVIIPEELDLTEYRNSLAIESELLYRYLDVEAII